jgi:hypothetical protein
MATMDGFRRVSHPLFFWVSVGMLIWGLGLPGYALGASRKDLSQDVNDEGNFEGYDSIVSGLSREVERPATLRARQNARSNDDGLSQVWFHGGVGATMMMQTLDFDDGSKMYLTMKGIQLAGGIDLFSRQWRAEGTLRNFGETTEQATRVSVQEFELKILFHDRLSSQLGFHAGAGLSARYISLHRPYLGSPVVGGPPNNNANNNGDYTTPTSIATGGLDFFLNDRITIGFELAARDALVSETIDQNSFDTTLRIDLQL